MTRRRLTIRPIRMEVQIPEDLHSEVTLLLWSDLEQRVPFGAYSALVIGLLREWKDKQNANAAV